MAKLSPEAQLIIEVARTDHGPDAAHRARLREQLLARAAKPEAFEPGPPQRVASRGRTFGLIAGGAVLVSAFVVMVSQRTSAPVARFEASPLPVAVTVHPLPMAVPTTDSMAPANLDVPKAPEAAPAITTPANPKTVTKTAPPPRALAGAEAAKPVPSAEPPTAPRAVPDEMRILRDAHAALKSGDLALARARLDEHADTFPHGIFREERMTLSALVYCAEGRRADARREAEALGREHPNSSHLDRLRGSCAAE